MGTTGSPTLDSAVLAGAGLPPPGLPARGLEPPEAASGPSPLVTAANPILNLVPQIGSLLQLEDIARLRLHLAERIKAFERQARLLGVAPDTIIGARYCLCTLLDEAASKTPWGGSGAWSSHSLLVSFHNETWGGEKFFQLLSRLAQNPQKHRDLLALMYYCLCLGFEGRFRIIDNGKAQLETLRQRLWQILRNAGAQGSAALSPHWQGEDGPGNRGWRLLPVWAAACMALLAGILVYLWFAFALADQSDKVFAQIGAIRLAKAAPPPRPAAAPPRLARFLEPEVREGLVSVRDEADRSTVTLRGDGLFASGSAAVLERHLPTLQRIAQALNTAKGGVLVSGHTDNIPIRTALYPSNFHLSQDRARQVMGLLAHGMDEPGRLRAQGLGESEPLVPNDSAGHRARNRRVEIVLLAAPVAAANE